MYVFSIKYNTLITERVVEGLRIFVVRANPGQHGIERDHILHDYSYPNCTDQIRRFTVASSSPFVVVIARDHAKVSGSASINYDAKLEVYAPVQLEVVPDMTAEEPDLIGERLMLAAEFAANFQTVSQALGPQQPAPEKERKS